MDTKNRWKFCEFCCAKRSVAANVDYLTTLLPHQFCHVICEVNLAEGTESLQATVYADVTTVADVNQWLTEFQLSSKMTFRIERGKSPGNSKKVIYKNEMRCMHRTRSSNTIANKLSSKNTGCKAFLKLRLMKTDFVHKDLTERGKPAFKRKSRSQNPHMPNYPFRVIMNLGHNHPLGTRDILRHRDVGPEAQEKIKKLLENKYSPAAALEIFKFDLQVEHPDDYILYAEDRYHCPDLQWCYRLHYRLFQQTNGGTNRLRVDELEILVQNFNAELRGSDDTDPSGQTLPENYIALHVRDEDVVVAICTPLMKRVHRHIKHSGELVYVDVVGGSTTHRKHTRVYALMSYSPAGGLPLGILILSNDRAANITTALHLYNTLLDGSCFFGRGLTGPAIILNSGGLSSDVGAADRVALQSVYPRALTFVCVYHVLRDFWRLLWDVKTSPEVSATNSQQYLFAIVEGMACAETEANLFQIYDSSTIDPVVLALPKVQKHLQYLYDRRAEWAPCCCRLDVIASSLRAGNMCERSMRVARDSLLLRTRAFTVSQLVDFVVTRSEMYYQHRLLEAAAGADRSDCVADSRFFSVGGDGIDASMIRCISANLYEVPDGGTIGQQQDEGCIAADSCFVDTYLGHCSCSHGLAGGACRHQWVLMDKLKVHLKFLTPVRDPVTRQLLNAVATGKPIASSSEDIVERLMTMSDGCSGELDDDLEDASTTLMDSKVVNPALLRRLDAAFAKIRNMCNVGSVSFEPALESFCEQVESITEVAAMGTALGRFGQDSSVSMMNTSSRNKDTKNCGLKVGGRDLSKRSRLSARAQRPTYLSDCNGSVGKDNIATESDITDLGNMELTCVDFTDCS